MSEIPTTVSHAEREVRKSFKGLKEKLTHPTAVEALDEIMLIEETSDINFLKNSVDGSTRDLRWVVQKVGANKIKGFSSIGRRLSRNIFSDVFHGEIAFKKGGPLSTGLEGGRFTFKKYRHNPKGKPYTTPIACTLLNEVNTWMKQKKIRKKLLNLSIARNFVVTQAKELYSVMPIYESGNLQAWMATEKVETEGLLRHWLQNLWDMGKQLRRCFVYHRDISPVNICIRQAPNSKFPDLILIDWRTSMVARGNICGNHTILRDSKNYQPPEIALATIEPRAAYEHDEWSLFVIMEAIAGKRAFGLFHPALRPDDHVPNMAKSFMSILGFPNEQHVSHAIFARVSKCILVTQRHDGRLIDMMRKTAYNCKTSNYISYDLSKTLTRMFEQVFQWNPQARLIMRKETFDGKTTK